MVSERKGRRTLAEIDNPKDLRAWLQDKPRDVAVVIAARTALRAIPFLPTVRDWRGSALALATFRATAVASAAAKYSAEAAEFASAAAAAADAAPAYAAPAYADAAADAAASAADAAPAYAADAAAYAAAAYADAAYADADAVSVLWDAISEDTALLDGGTTPDALARRKLWRRQSADVAAGWRALKSNLLSREGESWTVWTDWYEDRLAGRAGRKRLEIARVLIGDEIWQGRPEEVNRHIQTLIDEFRRKKTEVEPPPPAPPALPRVPPVRPAAIEPELENGRIILPRSPAAANSDPESIAAALATLKAELDDLAEDIEREDNLDKRFARRLRAIAERCVEAPTQVELFRLGHDYSVVAAFAQTVDAEWPGHLVAAYRALQLHYERCVRKFHKWVEFLGQPKETLATPDDIATVHRIGQHIVVAGRSEHGDSVIDPAIPDALEQMLGEDHATDFTQIVSARSSELAADILESANNILKRGAELFLTLQAKSSRTTAALKKVAREGAEAFGKGLKKGYLQTMTKAGEQTIPTLSKALRRLLIGGAALELYAKFPQTFGWLHDLSELLHTLA